MELMNQQKSIRWPLKTDASQGTLARIEDLLTGITTNQSRVVEHAHLAGLLQELDFKLTKKTSADSSIYNSCAQNIMNGLYTAVPLSTGNRNDVVHVDVANPIQIGITYTSVSPSVRENWKALAGELPYKLPAMTNIPTKAVQMPNKKDNKKNGKQKKVNYERNVQVISKGVSPKSSAQETAKKKSNYVSLFAPTEVTLKPRSRIFNSHEFRFKNSSSVNESGERVVKMIAKLDSESDGVGALQYRVSGSEFIIENLAVLPSNRRQGVATGLVRQMMVNENLFSLENVKLATTNEDIEAFWPTLQKAR